MKKSILGLVFCLFCCSASAQSVSAEAVRLANTLSGNSWQAFEQVMSTVIAGLQSQLKTAGATEKASAALSLELTRTFNRENFIRITAQSYVDSFSEAELKEINAFFQSQLGQKYLHSDEDGASAKKYFEPLLKQACVAATTQLDPSDRNSIEGACGRFQ